MFFAVVVTVGLITIGTLPTILASTSTTVKMLFAVLLLGAGFVLFAGTALVGLVTHLHTVNAWIAAGIRGARLTRLTLPADSETIGFVTTLVVLVAWIAQRTVPAYSGVVH